MLQAYEATPQPIVLLAGRRREALRLLGIVLEGFGYVAADCADAAAVEAYLSHARPDLAIVDAGLSESESICAMVLDLDDCPLLLLVDGEDGEGLQCEYGADACLPLDAEPELILRSVRSLFDDRSLDDSIRA